MTKLSDNKFSSPFNNKGSVKYIPFTAYIKVIPINGKRFEIIRDLENTANVVEEALDAIETIDLAKPVKFTPQFGNNSARLTINGNFTTTVGSTYSDNDNSAKQHIESTQIIHDNGIVSGYGAAHAANRVPDPTIVSLLREFLNVLADIGLTPYKIEVAGIIFGEGGITIPKAY